MLAAGLRIVVACWVLFLAARLWLVSSKLAGEGDAKAVTVGQAFLVVFLAQSCERHDGSYLPWISSLFGVVHAEKLLLHLILESKNRGARIVFARAQLSHFVRQLTADLPPIKSRILALQTIEFTGAATDLRRAAFGREGHNRADIVGNGTAAHLRGGVRGH